MDIVERLRRYSNPTESGSASWQEMIENSSEAADEIERLREALRKISNGYSDEDGMRNIARQALGEKE